MARTPHRLSLVGGGTDVKDYYNQYGGISINFAIDLYSSCTIKDNPNGGILLKSIDLHEEYFSNDLSGIYTDIQAFRLHKGVYEKVLKLFQIEGFSFEMITNSVVPLGSGLGGSSSMTISILKAFLKYLDKEFTNDFLRNLAYEIEREDLGIKGGVQDHLCATYGGFNVYYLSKDGVEIKPLNYEPLTHGLVLVYTGISRDGSILMDQSENKVKAGSQEKINALNKTKENAINFLKMMEDCNSKEIDSTINNSWINKISTLDKDKKQIIMKIYETGLGCGANCGRLLGAGNGGFMVFFCDSQNVENVGNAIKGKVPQVSIFYPKIVKHID